jgi:SAM-dependent methyltransferase
MTVATSPYFYAPASYHGGSLERQQADMTAAVLQRAGITAATCVLDVGCGAGQTLRIVEGLNRSASLIGVDPDESALAACPSRNGRVQFLKGEGENLPLANGVASHVICRVAINYMHQAKAIREMARVLAPRGRIVLSFIGLGYTLKDAVSSPRKGFRQCLGNLKDLTAGLLLQVAGFQGRRATLWGRSVPYTSCWRLRRQLHKQGCDIEWLACEGRYLGLGTIWWAIITKRPGTLQRAC